MSFLKILSLMSISVLFTACSTLNLNLISNETPYSKVQSVKIRTNGLSDDLSYMLSASRELFSEIGATASVVKDSRLSKKDMVALFYNQDGVKVLNIKIKLENSNENEIKFRESIDSGIFELVSAAKEFNKEKNKLFHKGGKLKEVEVESRHEKDIFSKISVEEEDLDERKDIPMPVTINEDDPIPLPQN